MTNWEAVELVATALLRGIAITASDAKCGHPVTAGPAPGDYRGKHEYAMRWTKTGQGEDWYAADRKTVASQFVTSVGRYAARRAVLAAEKAVST